MIVGAAVCPGAPFLIDGTADALAVRLEPVRSACARALSRVLDADELLLVTTVSSSTVRGGGPGWTVLPPGTPVTSNPLRRSDQPDLRRVALPTGIAHRSDDPELAGSPGTTASEDGVAASPVMFVGTIVGAHLLARLPTPAPPTTAVQVNGDPAGAAAMLADRVASARRVAIVAVADGSACHGDDAPGRRDDRAASFDAELAGALAAGNPHALSAATRRRYQAGELQAAVDPLAVLAALTMNGPPMAAELLFSGAPQGVGYLVASWCWSVP